MTLFMLLMQTMGTARLALSIGRLRFSLLLTAPRQVRLQSPQRTPKKRVTSPQTSESHQLLSLIQRQIVSTWFLRRKKTDLTFSAYTNWSSQQERKQQGHP